MARALFQQITDDFLNAVPYQPPAGSTSASGSGSTTSSSSSSGGRRHLRPPALLPLRAPAA